MERFAPGGWVSWRDEREMELTFVRHWEKVLVEEEAKSLGWKFGTMPV